MTETKRQIVSRLPKKSWEKLRNQRMFRFANSWGDQIRWGSRDAMIERVDDSPTAAGR